MMAEVPQGPVEIPRIVAELAGGRPVHAVWQNDLGGLTFQVGLGDARHFVKWTPPASGVDMAVEVARLRWAVRFTAVPRVLDEGSDETGTWFLMDALPGHSGVDDYWEGDVDTAVRALGSGLRALHEALPVAQCPFNWSAAQRLERVRSLAAAGRLDEANRWKPPGSILEYLGSVEWALEVLADIPPIDELAVCHGDACPPNTLIDDDGRCTGHVDLATMGVADRWADLAVATWSTRWNYGPGWEQQVLDAYGVRADPQRTMYYRLLWELADD